MKGYLRCSLPCLLGLAGTAPLSAASDAQAILSSSTMSGGLFVPGGASEPHGTSLGIEGRQVSISPADLATIGSSRGKDMQLDLFLRTRF